MASKRAKLKTGAVGIHGYTRRRKGMLTIQTSGEMQAHLVGVAGNIASLLNNYGEGHFSAGPYGEPVYSTHHPFPIGAHAFVRTSYNNDFEQFEAAGNLLNAFLGGG